MSLIQYIPYIMGIVFGMLFVVLVFPRPKKFQVPFRCGDECQKKWIGTIHILGNFPYKSSSQCPKCGKKHTVPRKTAKVLLHCRGTAEILDVRFMGKKENLKKAPLFVRRSRN